MDDLSDDTKKNYSSENLVKVSASQLQVGMYVAELDRPWLDTPFLTQGLDIRHPSQIAKIAQYCDHVYVLRQGASRKSVMPVAREIPPSTVSRANKGNMVARAGRASQKPKSLVRSRPSYENQKSALEEHPLAQLTYQQGKAVVIKLLDSVVRDEPIDLKSAMSMVSACVDSIIRNVDAMIWMSKIKHEKDYTVEHCLNACILSIVFGRHLNFDEAELRKLGLYALLHDVGKVKVPQDILQKPGALTEDEMVAMRQHTIEGQKALKQVKGLSPLVAGVARSHHERPDGGGYPDGLKEVDIPEYVRIVGVVDAYDAMTSDRYYDQGKLPSEAQKILYENRGEQFDEQCALQFMQAIGPYPPGTLVELKNDMVGIVLAGLRKFRHLPRVILALDSNKQPIPQDIIDLHLTDTGELGKDYLIKKALKDGAHGLRLEDFRIAVKVDD